MKWTLSHCALTWRGLFFFKLVFTLLFSPQLLKSSCVAFSVLCTLELLSFPSAALAIIPLPPIEVVLHPTCLSAISKRWETAPLQFGALPNDHPIGVDLGPPGAWAGGVVFPAFLPAGGQSNQLAPNLRYSPPSLMMCMLQNTTTE